MERRYSSNILTQSAKSDKRSIHYINILQGWIKGKNFKIG